MYLHFKFLLLRLQRGNDVKATVALHKLFSYHVDQYVLVNLTQKATAAEESLLTNVDA